LRINPNIQDERGYNIDLGLRGGNKKLRYDASVYYMVYKDRIGSIQMRDPNTFQFYRYRTNIAQSAAIGTEIYVDWSPIQQSESQPWGLSVFVNFSYCYARYNSIEDLSVDGNVVELTPEYTFRTGVRGAWKDLSATWQLSYVDEQYTDATNAVFTPNGVNGLIPSYTVMDLSMAYQIKNFEISAGVNNLANTAYFTRRAVGYPGPGIIPSDGLALYLTVGAKF
jgi:Fe(3+) dicitrate transport protein